jgi:hypothetical protein
MHTRLTALLVLATLAACGAPGVVVESRNEPQHPDAIEAAIAATVAVRAPRTASDDTRYQISWICENHGFQTTAKTDENGNYRLENVPLGTYTVIVADNTKGQYVVPSLKLMRSWQHSRLLLAPHCVLCHSSGATLQHNNQCEPPNDQAVAVSQWGWLSSGEALTVEHGAVDAVEVFGGYLTIAQGQAHMAAAYPSL